MNDELQIEPLEEDNEDNVIELQHQLIGLLEERQPIKQKYDELNHQIEKIKIRIKVATQRYFEGKGK